MGVVCCLERLALTRSFFGLPPPLDFGRAGRFRHFWAGHAMIGTAASLTDLARATAGYGVRVQVPRRRSEGETGVSQASTSSALCDCFVRPQSGVFQPAA